MPHANLYTPTAGFSDDANSNTPGRSGVNATSLDNELLRVSESINLIINNQKLMQRDDGRLKDTVVEVHTLSREVLMLLGSYRQRGAWLGQTEYTSGDVVTHDGLMYVCKNSHVSESTFIESPNWLQFGFAGSADAAQAAAQAASAANQAASSAASAQSSATTATTKASDANTSAQSAASSANSAQTASTSASNSAAQATSANNAAQAAAAVAQSAAQVSGISNERIIYGDDASKTSAVTSADLATTSGFFESSSDVPSTGKWLIINHKSRSENTIVQIAISTIDPSIEYVRRINNGVKSAWVYKIAYETNTSNIQQNGVASVGSSPNVARADHVHPTDTSREPARTQATQAEMEAGTLDDVRSMSPLRVKQAIAALTNIKTINSMSLLGSGDIQIEAAAYGLFRKADPTIVAWTKTGAFAVSTATTIYVDVNGDLKTIPSSTAVTMPGSATTGTDYAIWAKTDGTLEATTNHTSPPSANARKVGGFHYAPGGNATAQSGGGTTPQINEYSFWDLKFRPTCPDPRGMTLVAGGFWIDIYLTGVDSITNGSSKYNVTMADGSSPPKVPTMFGGNGSTTYGSYTWFEAMELATAFGKKCPTQQEFMSAAYGTTEASSIGTDQVSTILNAAYTSKWGVIQATGVLWVWGRDRGGAYTTGGWKANTEGRGSEYNAPNVLLLGGGWDNGSVSGSRCSIWSDAASYSSDYFGSRFCCDHLQLD